MAASTYTHSPFFAQGLSDASAIDARLASWMPVTLVVVPKINDYATKGFEWLREHLRGLSTFEACGMILDCPLQLEIIETCPAAYRTLAVPTGQDWLSTQPPAATSDSPSPAAPSARERGLGGEDLSC